MSRDTLFEVVERSSDGSTNIDIRIPEKGPVPRGQKWFIQRVSAEDETSAFTRVRFGKARANRVWFHSDEDALAAGEIATDPDPFVANEGEQVIVRFVGTVSADILRAIIQGFVKSGQSMHEEL